MATASPRIEMGEQLRPLIRKSLLNTSVPEFGFEGKTLAGGLLKRHQLERILPSTCAMLVPQSGPRPNFHTKFKWIAEGVRSPK